MDLFAFYRTETRDGKSASTAIDPMTAVLCRSPERRVEFGRPRDECRPMNMESLLAFVGGVLRLAATRVFGRHAGRLARRPAYAGTIVALAGLVGWLANPISVVGLLLLVAAVEWRIRAEGG